MEKLKNKKKLFLIMGPILIMILLAGGYFLFFKNNVIIDDTIIDDTIIDDTKTNIQDQEQIIDKIVIGTIEEAIEKLDTPEKLISFLNENFIFEPKEKDSALTPRYFFQERKGNNWDFAVFTSYILNKHQYGPGIIRYKYQDGTNAVVVFRDKDLPKTIIFTINGASIYHHGWSFEEMFRKEEERLGIKISEYAISYWTDDGDIWPEEWINRR